MNQHNGQMQHNTYTRIKSKKKWQTPLRISINWIVQIREKREKRELNNRECGWQLQTIPTNYSGSANILHTFNNNNNNKMRFFFDSCSFKPLNHTWKLSWSLTLTIHKCQSKCICHREENVSSKIGSNRCSCHSNSCLMANRLNNRRMHLLIVTFLSESLKLWSYELFVLYLFVIENKFEFDERTIFQWTKW